MEEFEKESTIIKFKKDVKELKIPESPNALLINEENTIEFIVEIE